ncbi:MAG: MarR family transcriptional regulator [Isosphaeraceae bacterium]
MSETIQRVRDLIEARLLELNEEAKRLEKAVEDFGSDGLGAARRRRLHGKRARSKRRGSRHQRRAQRGQRSGEFLAELEENPGATTSDLAKQIGVSPSQASGLARQLRHKGLVRKSGKGYRLTAKAKETGS